MLVPFGRPRAAAPKLVTILRLTGPATESPRTAGALPSFGGIRRANGRRSTAAASSAASLATLAPVRLLLISLAVAATAGAAPAVDEPIPRQPARLAGTIVANHAALARAIDRWDKRGRPPNEVTLRALYDQRATRLLAREPRLYERTLRLLPRRLVPIVRGPVVARRALSEITPVSPLRKIETGAALPPRRLISYYRKAERRFGVGWHVLAAVNFVETAFNKVRNESSAGAQGPMQFMPATWRAYGLGGDVHDPHDAIMGAANYLRASGAPRNYARALHAYNPSWRYVDAVSRYAQRIRVDRHAFYRFYSWQVIVRTPAGDRRLTGPGVGR